MQSSPKKGKLAASLRSVHLEQISKLNSKHQHETDLLEDIRLFAKQRAAIEKSYGESLLKLSTMLLQRKIPTVNEIVSDDGRDRKSVYSVWRMVLEENEKLSKARLAAAEVFHQQISESAKTVRTHKMQVNKKCLEQLQRIQDEILKSTRELDKAKKVYGDEEHVAHDVRDKAQEAEERLKKKKGHFFQSLSSLQKNSHKIANRKEVCDSKSNDARNEYLLCLVTVNAHQARYHDIDLPEIIKMMDVDMYEKTAEYFQLLSQTELFTCAATQTSFTKIKEVADLVTRSHNLKCYLNDWIVLRDNVQYQFEPCDGDKIDYVVENAIMSLTKEAKTSAARIAKETRSIRNYQKQLKTLSQQAASAQREEGTMDQLGIQDIEQKIDEIRQNIRKSETSRCKAEARIDLLRQGGVNVDEYVIDLDSLGPIDIGGGELSRAASTLSVRSNASGMDDVSGEYYDSDPNESAEKKPVEDSRSEAQDTGSLYGTQAEADWPADDDEQRRKSVYSTGETTSQGPLRFVALYSYTAQNPDELSIIEQEILEIVDEGEGDGWVKARNSQGIEGYVPQNYVEIESASEGGHGSMYPAPTSFSSVDYTMPDWGDEGDIAVPSEEIPQEVVETVPQPDVVPMEAVEPTVTINVDELPTDSTIVTCKALFDYEANGPEELSFVEGQIIKVIRKFVHSVDDGWWEGEIDGQTGIFPSLVVEELAIDGQLLSPDELLSPSPCSEPPPFAPPPMPQFLSAAAHVIITQPTPDTECIDEDYYSQKQEDDEEDKAKEEEDKTGGPVAYSYSDPSFEMEMSEDHQRHYKTQFSANTDNNANETDANESEITEEQVASEIQDVIEEVKEVLDQMETEMEEMEEIADESDDKRVIPDINLTSASPQMEETPNGEEEEEEEGGANEVDEVPNDNEGPTG
ncbi:hypothetical protein CHUAL_006916 [Chamberlinius hualienensis]